MISFGMLQTSITHHLKNKSHRWLFLLEFDKQVLLITLKTNLIGVIPFWILQTISLITLKTNLIGDDHFWNSTNNITLQLKDKPHRWWFLLDFYKQVLLVTLKTNLLGDDSFGILQTGITRHLKYKSHRWLFLFEFYKQVLLVTLKSNLIDDYSFFNSTNNYDSSLKRQISSVMIPFRILQTSITRHFKDKSHRWWFLLEFYKQVLLIT